MAKGYRNDSFFKLFILECVTFIVSKTLSVMEQIVKILSIEPVTHDVKQYRTEKPLHYQFVPGQATEVSINKPGWREEKRPFTFTCLNQQPYLEFVIKSYRDHDGVTNELDKLKIGDELIVRDIWGAINYQGEGYFIAGGAGITPFIAILRELKKNDQIAHNKLFFSNKTKADIILKNELEEMLHSNAFFITTQENMNGKGTIRINEQFLKENINDFTKQFYICGPDKMVGELSETLVRLGANATAVVFEK
jgi:ferredoxin-NADP reductase